MKFQKPKGTKDILPKDMHKWHYAERIIREVMSLFNFSEIRTPTFESTGLFTRGVGSETDIVGKEIYTFEDKAGNSLTLKPEMTAPVMRAYIENGMGAESPIHKLYYITSMFRHEKPQLGRYREHTQFGAEIIGSDHVNTDVELILLAKEIYSRLGITDFRLKINSIGKPGDRTAYVKKLKEYLSGHAKNLSEDSQKRLRSNPLRILDSKDSSDKTITDNAPKILEFLSDDSKKRFHNFIKSIEKMNIKYELDYRLVRGLDYYTDTTFEFVSEQLGGQDAIGGGGRYDGLADALGGKSVPGVGFGSGLERVLMCADKINFVFPSENNLSAYIIPTGEDTSQYAFELCARLRAEDIACEMDYLGRSVKAQMREANKMNSGFVIILGEEEMKRGKLILKKMEDGSQSEIDAADAENYLTAAK